ncbi:MAG: type II toxin-antitoxin system VapC family toxin [Aestuariivirga sp.]
MILVDTSVWIDHLRKPDSMLARLLEEARIVTHPFIIGEIALGSLKNRKLILTSLAGLPAAIVASDEEVLSHIDAAGLAGAGIGYLDAHLLASAKLTSGARIWTRDNKLRSAAIAAGVAAAMM